MCLSCLYNKRNLCVYHVFTIRVIYVFTMSYNKSNLYVYHVFTIRVIYVFTMSLQ